MIRVLLKLCFLVLIQLFIIIIFLIILPALLTPLKKRLSRLILYLWAAAILRVLCIKTNTSHKERLTPKPILVMANHQSIIDIPVLLKLEDCRLIAKHSILWWPFIGPMAFILGIIFIKREAIKTLKPAIARAGMTLVQGISLAVFPEIGRAHV